VLANERWLLLLMGALALSVGAAKGAASLGASKGLAPSAETTHAATQKLRRVSPRLIRRYRNNAWRWQALMGKPRARHAVWPNTTHTMRTWRRTARRAYIAYVHPPHKSAWLCIHRFEGSWRDSGDPYWGGLQMDRSFMSGYAPHHLLRRGWADRWSPLEQMWVAERAYRSGRGFYAWPNAARTCGLI
jgi:hypothetical protein